MIKLFAAVGVALALAACAKDRAPASLAGECQVFEAPSEPVQGVRPVDRRWIAKTIEAGVVVCRWKRPA